MGKIGRNDPCPCGSGKKYKKCCQREHDHQRVLVGRVDEGVIYDENGKEQEACDLWWTVWEDIKPKFTPEMRDTSEAQEIFPKTQLHIYDWLQFFSDALIHAAFEDASYAKKGIEVCRTVLKQLPDEPEDYLRHFHFDLAEFLFIDGQYSESETQFASLIKKNPDKAEPYSVYSDLLLSRWDKEGNPDDLQHGIELLEQALAYPATDAESFNIPERLDYYRNDVQKNKTVSEHHEEMKIKEASKQENASI